MASCRARCSSSSEGWSAVWYMAVSRIARSPALARNRCCVSEGPRGPIHGRHGENAGDTARGPGAQHLGGFGRGRPGPPVRGTWGAGRRHRTVETGPQAPTRSTDYRMSNYVARKSHHARQAIGRCSSHPGRTRFPADPRSPRTGRPHGAAPAASGRTTEAASRPPTGAMVSSSARPTSAGGCGTAVSSR